MSEQPVQKQHVPIKDILLVFIRVGLTSFGGAPVAWMHREIVVKRGWMTDDGFVTGYTIAQVLPGANAVNLALYIGLQTGGGWGAAAASAGIVGPAFVLILIIGALYGRFGNTDAAHAVLLGFAVVGLGLSLSIGYRMASRIGARAAPLAIAAGIFAAVGVFHWPMVPVVIVLTPVSVFAEYYLNRDRKAGS